MDRTQIGWLLVILGGSLVIIAETVAAAIGGGNPQIVASLLRITGSFMALGGAALILREMGAI